MKKYNREEFLAELKKIHSDLKIEGNPMFPTMARIMYKGECISSMPSGDVFEHVSELYVNERGMRHKCASEILGMVKKKIQRISSDKDYNNAYFGTGEYTDAKLKQ